MNLKDLCCLIYNQKDSIVMFLNYGVDHLRFLPKSFLSFVFSFYRHFIGTNTRRACNISHALLNLLLY